MMGERTVVQEALFYSFSIENHVPADHLLRSIDRFVDLGSIREHLRPYYSDTGRPSIDPELMIRMLIVGYAFKDYLTKRYSEFFNRIGPSPDRQVSAGNPKQRTLDRGEKQAPGAGSRRFAANFTQVGGGHTLEAHSIWGWGESLPPVPIAGSCLVLGVQCRARADHVGQGVCQWTAGSLTIFSAG